MKIFFSAGEPSGDLHGANLIRALKAGRSDIEAVGFGGPNMQTAGCELLEDMTRLAVMWFLQALLRVHTFLGLLWRANRVLRDERPDLVLLIDFPGFNWWVARRARAHGIPVVYYGAPQIWAWAPWRIGKMRRLVDHILCKLPFEEAWYRERGCQATYVGHPFFDEVRRYKLDRPFVESQRSEVPLVTILPGSRTQEVNLNLKWLLKAAGIVQGRVPQVRFAVAAFRPAHAVTARREIDEARAAGLLPAETQIDVFVRRAPDLMHAAHCCMAVSGSVSLELLYHARPTVVHYWISPLADFVQSYARRVKYITLVNLLVTRDLRRTDRRNYDPRAAGAERVPLPEYLTSEDRSADVAHHVIEWLTDERAYAARVAELEQLRERFGHPGASQRAAEFLLARLGGATGPPRPHFLSGAEAPERAA